MRTSARLTINVENRLHSPAVYGAIGIHIAFAVVLLSLVSWATDVITSSTNNPAAAARSASAFILAAIGLCTLWAVWIGITISHKPAPPKELEFQLTKESGWAKSSESELWIHVSSEELEKLREDVEASLKRFQRRIEAQSEIKPHAQP